MAQAGGADCGEGMFDEMGLSGSSSSVGFLVWLFQAGFRWFMGRAAPAEGRGSADYNQNIRGQ